MRTITFFLAGICFLGMNAHPLVAFADATADTKSPVVKRMYLDWVQVRDKVRATKMEIADLQAKIGATIQTDTDRANMSTLLADDTDKLRGYRAALQEGTLVLASHWGELTPNQQFDVREQQTYPE